MAVTGQLWYSTEGIDEDALVAYVNSDSNSPTIVVDNNPTIDLVSGFANHVVLDTAAGLYFVLVGGNDGTESKLLMGRIGSAAAPTIVFNFDPTPSGNPNAPNNIALSLEIDPINERLYVGFADFTTFGPTDQGIRQFSYNTTSGAVSGGAFIATQASANIPSSAPGGTGIFGPRDFDIDATRNVMYFTQFSLGNGFETNVLMRLNLLDPDGSSAVSLVNPALFALDGDGSDFTTVNGIIQDVEVDVDSDRVYFVTHAEDVDEGGAPGDPEDGIWLVTGASTAVNATPTKLSLSAGVFATSFVTTDFYPGDMVLDEVNNILYVDSENSNLPGGGVTDRILKFQLASNGLSATLIDVINPGFDQTANIEGLHFNQLAEIGALTANAAQAVEQVTNLDLLNSAPVISDFDHDHLNNATVAISNSFVGSGDNLYALDGVTQRTSGTFTGTNITVSRTTDGSGNQTLTFTGYDTFANYQTVLNSVAFIANGNNPTNFGSNGTRTVTWQVNDGAAGNPSGTVNGADTNVRTSTITIQAVNDAPVNTVPGVAATIAEDALTALSGFSVADADADPANQDIQVTLSVSDGVIDLLTNVGGGITAGDVANNATATVTITATQNQINATFAASGLRYQGALNFNGGDVLTMATNDLGNTGTPGLQTDTDFLVINVSPVNDAPAGTDNTVSVAEDASYTFTAADFGFTDPSDAPFPAGADDLARVLITTAPTNGQLLLDDGLGSLTAVTAGSFVTIADINSGFLSFAPDANENDATAYASFTFQVEDDGATGGANVNLDQSANTFTVNVTPVNDAPNVVSATQSMTAINEDDTSSGGESVGALFTASFSDAEDDQTVLGGSTANGLAGVAIVANAAGVEGQWQYSTNGLTWTAIPSSVSNAASLLLTAATLVRFVPAPNFNGLAPALTARLVDDSGLAFASGDIVSTTTNGDPTPYSIATVTLDQTINAVNDAPDGADDTIIVVEDGSHTFSAADFGFTDQVDAGGSGGADALLEIIIDSVPALGSLTLSGNPVLAGAVILATDIPNLVYTPAADDYGAGYASLTFRVRDDGGTANLGSDTDPVANTITFDLTAVADAPQVTNATTDEDEQTTSGLVLTRNAADGAEVTHFKITGITNGTLFLNDGTTQISNGDFITFAQGSAGLKFTPAANVFGANVGSFTAQGSTAANDGGLGVGNTTAFVTVNAVADTPSVTNATVSEDGQSTAGLVISRNAADGAEVTHFKITGITNGTLFLNDGTTALSDGAFVSVADASAGLKFSPTPNFFGNGSFDIQASTISSDSGLGGSVVTATITVNPVNDEPSGADNTITLDEDGFHNFTAGDFGFSDSVEGDSFAGVVVTTLPLAGVLLLDDGIGNISEVVAGQTISAADITAGNFFYEPDRDQSGAGYASFTFQVIDDGGTANGGEDTDQSANTITFDVDAVNDAPRIFLQPALDVVVALPNIDDVVSVIGDGDGDFIGPASVYPGPGGDGPTAIALGDFDGDGFLDIAIANQIDGTVTILIGDGCGCFDEAAGSPITIGADATAIVTADINGDAFVDLLVANEGDDSVSILIGAGDGTFAPNASVGIADPLALAFAVDLNGDGDGDFATGNANGTVTVVLSDGVGGFTSGNIVVGGAADAITSVAVGDVNGDGRLDIAATDSVGNVVSLALGDGAGNFAAPLDLAVGSAPSDIAFGDFDGDTDLDIAVANAGDGTISVLLNTGGGVFAPQVTYATGTGPSTLAVADMNEDGNLDIVVGNLGSQDLEVFLGAGDGTFASFVTTPALDDITDIAIGNIDPDMEDSYPLFRPFTEGETLALTPRLVLSDADGVGTTAVGATVFLDDGFGGGALPGDVLGVDTTGTAITATYDPNTGVLTLSALTPQPLADFQQVLRTLTFASGDDPDDEGNAPGRFVGISVDDGGVNGEGFSMPILIAITAVDDPAVARNDAVGTTENSVLFGDVFADNGSGEDDPDGPVAPVVSAVNGNAGSVSNQVTLLSGALLTLNADGTFDYVTNGAFDDLPGPASGAANTATDSFTYTLASGGTATVTITINGEDSDDTLVGAPGGQNLDGGVGDDTVDYSTSPTGVEVRIPTGQGLGGDAQGDTYTGIENVIGSAFADVIVGGDQSSTLDGGDGNDTILGRGQSDTLLGGDGDDLLDGEAGGDVLNGGIGVDTASYFGSPAGVQVRLTTGAGLGGNAQGDTLISIENLLGSAFDDLLVGSDMVGNVLDGHTGNDTLLGRSGDDTLEGRIGNDLLDGGLGADLLRGGDGVDTASYANSAAAVTVSLQTGLGSGGEAAGDRLTFMENLIGSAQGDALTGSNGVANLIQGGGGADTLLGLSGADTLEGGAGDDILDGGADGDILRGGADFDTVRYTGQGAVTVNLTTGLGGGAAAGDRYTSIEKVIGSNFGDTLTAVNGVDVTLEGAIGDDALFGQNGADTLVGGLGADDLFGGFGNDTFVFSAAADSTPGARDEILDFEARVGEDETIDLRGFAGVLDFIGTAAFSAANQVRIHDDPGPHLTIEINTIGLNGAEAAITLLNTTLARIDIGDFLLT